jgi:hypothetical protein
LGRVGGVERREMSGSWRGVRLRLSLEEEDYGCDGRWWRWHWILERRWWRKRKRNGMGWNDR